MSVRRKPKANHPLSSHNLPFRHAWYRGAHSSGRGAHQSNFAHLWAPCRSRPRRAIDPGAFRSRGENRRGRWFKPGLRVLAHVCITARFVTRCILWRFEHGKMAGRACRPGACHGMKEANWGGNRLASVRIHTRRTRLAPIRVERLGVQSSTRRAGCRRFRANGLLAWRARMAPAPASDGIFRRMLQHLALGARGRLIWARRLGARTFAAILAVHPVGIRVWVAHLLTRAQHLRVVLTAAHVQVLIRPHHPRKLPGDLVLPKRVPAPRRALLAAVRLPRQRRRGHESCYDEQGSAELMF